MIAFPVDIVVISPVAVPVLDHPGEVDIPLLLRLDIFLAAVALAGALGWNCYHLGLISVAVVQLGFDAVDEVLDSTLHFSRVEGLGREGVDDIIGRTVVQGDAINVSVDEHLGEAVDDSSIPRLQLEAELDISAVAAAVGAVVGVRVLGHLISPVF